METKALLNDEAASPNLVSVLIPVYNVEKYLEETVRSILNQSYRDIEVLLLDDGSTDGSMAVASKLAATDSRIVILPPAGYNRGVVATRNDLLRAARGAYIAWNDSDDISTPDRIARQLDFLKNNPQFGAVGTGIVFADENLVPQSSTSYPAEPERQRTDPYLCCATIMATRAAAQDAGLFRRVFRFGGEDGDWILKMSDKHDVTNIPNALYTYRRHPQSLTHNMQNWSLTVRIGVFARYAARLRRLGNADPVDLLDDARLPEQLNAWAFLDNEALSHEEILTALSRRLDGEAPALSILHGVVAEDAEARAIVAGYDLQTFHSFEVLLAVRQKDLARIEAIVKRAQADIRLVPITEGAPWPALIEAARGRYLFMLSADNAPPPPWAVHEFVSRCLQARDSNAKLPRDCKRIDVTGEALRTGKRHRLAMKADEAKALLLQADGRHPGLIIEAAAESGLANVWHRTKVVYRNHGAIAVLEATARNLKLIAKRLAARVIYKWLAPRILKSDRGQAFLNLPLMKRLKDKLRTKVLQHAPDPVSVEVEAAPPPTVVPKTFPMDYAKAAAEARIKVGVYECWGDFVDSLHFMTPDGTPLVDGVMFAPMEEVENPDFVLVLNTPAQEQVSATIAPERLWFAIGEPPTAIHRPLHRGQGTHSTIVTCDLSLPDGDAFERRYIHAPVMTRTWHVKRQYQELEAMEPLDKPKKLSWVTSNLRILDGHRYRMQFLEKLRERVDFDLFGRGFNPIDDKWDAIAPYRYSIAFENVAAPLYFTEKLMDCFVCQTMPFYFGDPEIEKRFPSKSMVRIDPEDPKVFDMIRDISASELWKERQGDIAEARELVLKKYNMYRVLSERMREAALVPPGEAAALQIMRQTVL
jgi:glycosyltransferase involved in cell wall biosynthesis